mgnify:CR=1 FL=1
MNILFLTLYASSTISCLLANNFSSLKLATIDYEYPIAHPDLSITALCYIQRIRMSHFIHAGDMTSAAGKTTPIYLGTRLNFDTNFLKLMAYLVKLKVYYRKEKTNNREDSREDEILNPLAIKIMICKKRNLRSC